MNKPRLIDANELTNAMNNKYKEIKEELGYIDHTITKVLCIVHDLINEQPTAYDIDKVIKELINHTKECTDRTTYEVHSFVSLFDAIKIVKGNGNENSL